MGWLAIFPMAEADLWHLLAPAACNNRLGSTDRTVELDVQNTQPEGRRAPNEFGVHVRVNVGGPKVGDRQAVCDWELGRPD